MNAANGSMGRDVTPEKAAEFSAAHAATQLWAKTGNGYEWLNLPQHMADSAAVARELAETWIPKGTREVLAEFTHLDLEHARDLIVFCAGVHDLGKASIPFQTQATKTGQPEYGIFAGRVTDAGLPLPANLTFANTEIRHWHLSAALLEPLLTEHYGVDRTVARELASIAGSHHGKPLTAAELKQARTHIADPSYALWMDVNQHLLATLIRDTGTGTLFESGALSGIPLTAQMLLCGIVIASDWTASNERYFPLDPSGAKATTPDDEAARLADALPVIGLTPAITWRDNIHDSHTYYTQRFDWPEGREPNALQRTAYDVAQRMTEPGIMFIEAPMGHGKTEASLACAEIFAARFGKGGVFYATPTTATSDGLFPRYTHWASGLGTGRATSLFLAHSRSALNDEYQQLRKQRDQYFGTINEESPLVVERWLSSRKGGILAQNVIGTIDQLLLMALNSKHVMLRHLGFANKVVVIDEAHAYDAYMNVYLERALAWLGAYRVPVIILSATLPSATRDRLREAYNDGIRQRPKHPTTAPASTKPEAPANSSESAGYPLITLSSASAHESIAVDPGPDSRELAVESIGDDLGELVSVTTELLADGGCALVICNTVRRAQAAYAALHGIFGDDVMLIHSQFVAADRATKEEQLLTTLGPSPADGSPSQRPARRIVVSTQVVEQSLDVDFDVMITDFCPVDLLLQRSGRLHRHQRPDSERPERLRQPRLFIRGITAHGAPGRLPTFVHDFSGSIYSEGLLVATYAALREQLHGAKLQIPHDINPLVQTVYREPLVEAIPDEWKELAADALRKHDEKVEASRGRAKVFTLSPPLGPDFGGGRTLTTTLGEKLAAVSADSSEERAFAQVRDTDPSLEVLVAVRTSSGEIRLLDSVARKYDVSQQLLASTLLVPDERFAGALARSALRLPHAFSKPKVFDKAVAELESEYANVAAWQKHPLLVGQLILFLSTELTATLADIHVSYDEKIGLVTESGKNV